MSLALDLASTGGAGALPVDLDFDRDREASPARMNRAMTYLYLRLAAATAMQPEFESAIAQLQAVGLDRLNEVLTPIFQESTAIAAQLDAIKAAWLTGAPLAQLLADLDAAVDARLVTVDALLASVPPQLAANLAAVTAQLAAQDAAVTDKLAALGTMSTRAKATVADLFAWTADKGVTADAIGSAFAQQSLGYAATLVWDWRDGFYRGPVVCTGNVTIATPTSIRPGETRILTLQGNDATARTVSFSSAYKGTLPQVTDMTATRPYRFLVFADTATALTIDARALA